MPPESIENIQDIAAMRSISETRVKNTKKISIPVKLCVYFKDKECRAPLCDMPVCEKCPEGSAYCSRVAFIRTMVQKIL